MGRPGALLVNSSPRTSARPQTREPVQNKLVGGQKGEWCRDKVIKGGFTFKKEVLQKTPSTCKTSMIKVSIRLVNVNTVDVVKPYKEEYKNKT